MPESLETIAGFVLINNRHRTDSELASHVEIVLGQQGRIIASFQDATERGELYCVGYLVRASASSLDQLKRHPAVGKVYTGPIQQAILYRMGQLQFPHKKAIMTAMGTWNKYLEKYASSQSL